MSARQVRDLLTLPIIVQLVACMTESVEVSPFSLFPPKWALPVSSNAPPFYSGITA